MRKWGKKQRNREGMKYSHKLIKKKGSLAIQRKRKRTKFGKNTNERLEKDTVTKRDRVCMATREKYLSSTVTVSFSAAIRSLARLKTPKPQAHTRIEIEEEKSK